MRKLLCLWRGKHLPLRQAVGGWRCGECGEVGDDLGEMLGLDRGGVPHVRRVFSRERGGGLVRTSAWEETKTGGW